MASQTLAMAAVLINDEIVRGVAEDIITVNPMYTLLPFDSYDGQSINVPRENALGDSQVLGVGDTITAKAAATFTNVAFSSTTIIGDVEMNGLVQAQSASAGVDQIAIEISSKAKSIGRQFQSGMAIGDGTGDNMNSVNSLVDASEQTNTAGAQGAALSFEILDELLDLVVAKDGEVDWIMLPGRTLRSLKSLYRALGGVSADWVVTLPDGRTTIGYESIPVFKNGFLPVDETQGSETAASSVYAGVWDDGSRKIGVTGIHPASVSAGVQIDMVGQAEVKDMNIIRLKQYANFAVMNRRGLARVKGINN